MDAQQITQQLGGRWQNGYGTAPCPVCQSERRQDQSALSLKNGDGRLLAHCFKAGCSFRDIADALNLPLDRVQLDQNAIQEAAKKRAEYQAAMLTKARNVWGQSRPIQGSKAESYLRSRGITIDPPNSLRFLPDTYHGPSGRYLCAMVASVEPTGGIHRTFFTKQGERISGTSKMMLGPCAGSAVRLSEGVGPLVVCEGIETGLSLVQSLFDRSPSVWAALSTSGVKTLQLPDTPSDLIIAPDMDENGAGQNASTQLANRATALGWKVSMLLPPNGFNDWNDAMQAEVAA